ncbi:receptor protein-tyrosine kinase [Aeromicrobium panaciterrae]|uniref:non-specific protein-tyrosine kinase n=1 Tax=Aeromicrobium panaciterrae TaxID=363861 RepID=A0ABU1UL87_9ACTN|nr:polysaccharide biosynthesis tyrosine autokinase [Aeromicrobium panaciterrae]MDR7085947.1 receptor protein-tyrosine kinase [Aeromicrobium panaciterrae]
MSPHQLGRRWPSIVVLTLLGIAVAVGLLSTATQRYSAHADVLIAPPPAESTHAVDSRTVASYGHVLGGRTIAGRVVKSLGLSDSVAATDRRLHARVLKNTSVLRVTAEDSNSQTAARIAQESAEQFVSWLEDNQAANAANEGAGDENGATTSTALTASVVEDAATPSSAFYPSRPMWLAIGAGLGLLAGLLFATWRELADRSVRTPTELEELAGAPVLGAMAYDRAAASTPLITSLGTHHPRFEAVRILRTNLQFLDVDRDHKVITITSSLAGEGKSTTACNLAIALAQTGTRVVLVEGDLRRPRVSEYLGIEKSVGLTTVLVGRVALDAALQQAGTPGLDVLTSGALPPNPSEILQTKAMTALVAELRHRYEVVLIDAPPLLPVTDASLLASISDGAILVVRHGSTGREQVRTATERLQAVGARLLGTVLSMSPARELSRYGYGYGYGYGPEYFSKTATGGQRRGARRS